MATDHERTHTNLTHEQKLEEEEAKRRCYYPLPLFCHSAYHMQLIEERKIGYGKFGPHVAEHLPTGRPLLVNDNMEHREGCFDKLSDRAAVAWAHQTMRLQCNGLYDKYSPYGQEPTISEVATLDAVGGIQ